MKDKDMLKRIIIENQEFVERLDVLKRNITFEKRGNYVFTGPRRAGKTFCMFQVIRDLMAEKAPAGSILYINFEDERLLEFTAVDFDLLIEAYKEMFDHTPVFFLDEIQIIPGWDSFVRRLSDLKYRVYVTGSNAKMLSREIASVLGGRFLIKEIYPFSFREFLAARGYRVQKNWEAGSGRFKMRRHFETYFHFGGFPEIMLFDEKRQWLENLYHKMFYGDLIARYKIRNDFALKLLIKKLAESVHTDISYNRIRHIIQSAGVKIGTSTVVEYVSYLLESYLVFESSNYFSKLGERETSKKYYFTDNGLLSLFIINPETRLLENMVACELKRRNKPLYFAKDNEEVDFFIPGISGAGGDQESTAIQVCYSLHDPETRERETAALLKLNKKLKAKHLFIITMDEALVIKEGKTNINVIPVMKWILEDGASR
jgi:predicted AAA+ superfamily ATPase